MKLVEGITLQKHDYVKLAMQQMVDYALHYMYRPIQIMHINLFTACF